VSSANNLQKVEECEEPVLTLSNNSDPPVELLSGTSKAQPGYP
jgi:hypothetical protein